MASFLRLFRRRDRLFGDPSKLTSESSRQRGINGPSSRNGREAASNVAMLKCAPLYAEMLANFQKALRHAPYALTAPYALSLHGCNPDKVDRETPVIVCPRSERNTIKRWLVTSPLEGAIFSNSPTSVDYVKTHPGDDDEVYYHSYNSVRAGSGRRRSEPVQVRIQCISDKEFELTRTTLMSFSWTGINGLLQNGSCYALSLPALLNEAAKDWFSLASSKTSREHSARVMLAVLDHLSRTGAVPLKPSEVPMVMNQRFWQAFEAKYPQAPAYFAICGLPTPTSGVKARQAQSSRQQAPPPGRPAMRQRQPAPIPSDYLAMFEGPARRAPSTIASASRYSRPESEYGIIPVGYVATVSDPQPRAQPISYAPPPQTQTYGTHLQVPASSGLNPSPSREYRTVAEPSSSRRPRAQSSSRKHPPVSYRAPAPLPDVHQRSSRNRSGSSLSSRKPPPLSFWPSQSRPSTAPSRPSASRRTASSRSSPPASGGGLAAFFGLQPRESREAREKRLADEERERQRLAWRSKQEWEARKQRGRERDRERNWHSRKEQERREARGEYVRMR